MASSIYSFTRNSSFRNSGIEKKYIQQTAVYFKSSLKFLLCFLPVYGFFDCYNFYALLIVVPLWFCRPLYLIRGVFFVLSLTLVRSEFVSLLMD